MGLSIMYKKGILTFILLICMLCTMMYEHHVQNVQTQDAEDFIYEIVDEEVKITGYTGDISGDLIILDSVTDIMYYEIIE